MLSHVFRRQQTKRQSAASRSGGSPVATVLLFSRTEVFKQAIRLGRARELCPRMGENGFFVTARTVDESVAEAFYRDGMGLTDATSDA